VTRTPAPPDEVVPDAALLAASGAGETEAFATFMRRYQGPLERYLAAFTGSLDVDDAVQDALVAAWRAASAFRGDSSARGWLYTIARHAVHHQRRRRVDEPAQLESLEALAEQAGWGQLAAIADPQHDDDGRAELLYRALALLPREEREVLTLRELDGFSGEEAAAAMHLTLAAMKSRLHRARIHLAAVARSLAAAEQRSDAIRHTVRTGGAT
jgi:RNA polymerase sigma-70 factor (ECF subfamily)